MKLKLLFSCLIFLVFLGGGYGQVSITNAVPIATINFSASMQTSVGSSPSTPYEGDGFAPNPTGPGRLNSNAWEIKGWSFGNCLFGGTQTVDDFARGSVSAGVITGGMYAFTDLPGSVANPAMMIQPGDAGDFAPGTITLKIKNNGTSNLTQLAIDYNLFVHNDEATSSSFNFSHSPDNAVFVNEPLLNYTSPDVADAFQWVLVGTAPSRTCIVNGLNIPPGGFYYIRWSSNNVTGVGNADEFGLDDIKIMGTYGAPAPEINVTSYGATILSGDTTPTVGEGTEFAPSYAPISTLLTSQLISYTIQNLGGAPLNISNVTITGTNASDFTLSAAPPVGSIPAAVGGTISTKTITVIFDPSASGLRTARVNIFSDDSDENPYWFDIQGYGIVPIPDIRINGGPTGGLSIITSGSMVPYSFNNTLYAPSQIVGGAGLTNGFEIRNDCPQNAPLLLTDPSPYITIGGSNPADFTLVTIPSGNSIIPGAKKQFSIKFSPTASGIRTAIVSVASNDPDENPYTFLVQGTGVAPEIDIYGNAQPIISGTTSTSFVNYTFFDYLNIATGTLDRSFTIVNSGNVVLTLGALTISGPNAADFSVITAPPASLAAAATATFVIRFDPSAVGLRNATISIVNNDSNENPYVFAVSGYGLDYTPCSFAALQTIAIQDFETVAATPVWNYTATGTSTILGGTGFGSSGDAGSSSKFIGARSLQVANGTATVTMANVNTAIYDNVDLNFRLAAMAVTASEGLDATDKITVAVSANGGTTWSSELDILGNTDAKWSFASGTGVATTVFDNDNISTIVSPLSGGFLTSTGYSTISLTALPKVASLAIRFTITNNNASEIWAIDNVTLFGRKEISTTWTGSWSNGVPNTSTKAIIDGTYDTAANGSISACKCQINAGRNVTVSANTVLDVQSDLNNYGNLTIDNSGSLLQHNDLASNLGVVKVKRFTTFMKAYDYTYWSSPVVGQTLFGLSPTTRFDKYFSFSPTIGNWVVSLNGVDIMAPGKGYIVRAPDTFNATPTQYTGGEFNGVPNNGVITTPITVGVSNMNLIGNPYPSAISATAFLSNPANVGVVEGTIYLWTHNTAITNYAYNSNDYAVFNTTGPVGTRPALNPGLNNTTPTGNIASGQGFFIKGLSNGVATFNNSMRLSGSNAGFFRSSNNHAPLTHDSHADATGEIERNRIWLNIANDNGAFKQTLVGYIQGATDDIDRGFDGELFNANTFVSLYSIVRNTNMAIQGRALPFNESDQVPLGYNATVAGLFQISIENVDGIMQTQNIYLEDKLLNVIHDLKIAPYSFETAIGTFDDRFVLRYNNTTLAADSFAASGNAIILTVNKKQVDIYSQEENMKSVSVYDLLGRNIFDKQNINGKKFTISDLASAQQALVVKIVLENGKIISKKIVL